jgi:hypothetical protein
VCVRLVCGCHRPHNLNLTGVAACLWERLWERPRVVAASNCVRSLCREHDVSVARGASLGHDSCIGAHTVIDEDAQVLHGGHAGSS